VVRLQNVDVEEVAAVLPAIGIAEVANHLLDVGVDAGLGEIAAVTSADSEILPVGSGSGGGGEGGDEGRADRASGHANREH